MKTSLDVIEVESITFVVLVVALESEFEFKWNDEILSIDAFSTIKSIIEYIKSKTNK